MLYVISVICHLMHICVCTSYNCELVVGLRVQFCPIPCYHRLSVSTGANCPHDIMCIMTLMNDRIQEIDEETVEDEVTDD